MGVLSSIFGSQPAQPVVGAQPLSVTEIPEQLKPYYTDILSKAQALYNKRTDEGYTPYEGPTIAPYSPEQEQAFTGIAGLQGGTAPKYAEAEQMTRDAASGITGAQIQEAMSPYQQAVTDIEKRESQKAFEQNVLPKIRAAQVAQGSFGGTRGTLLEAQSLGEQQKLLSDIQTKGSQAAFADARAALDAERTRQGQASTNLANIAGAGFKTGLAELGAQQGVGEAKQQQTQAALDEAYRQFLQEKDEPYQAMQKYQQVVSGAPISTTTYAPPPAAQPSLGQQLIGGLAGVGSLYGTFTGKPIFGEGKTGGGIAGLVKRATPGQVGNMSAYDSFMEKRTPTTFPDVTSTKGGFDTLKGSIGSLIETLRRQGVSNTQIGNLLNEEIKKDKAALINPQVAKEQAAFKAIQDTIYSPEITEAGSTGRMALAALGKTGVEVGEQVKKAKEKTRAEERAIAEKEAALVKGMAADDVSAAGTAVAASEKLATIEATTAKNKAAASKMGLKFNPTPDDITKIVEQGLSNQDKITLSNSGQVQLKNGEVTTPLELFNKVFKEELALLVYDFENDNLPGGKETINQVFNQRISQSIQDNIAGVVGPTVSGVGSSTTSGSTTSGSTTSGSTTSGSGNRGSTSQVISKYTSPMGSGQP
tara:strand:+ start:2682 stop:4619 length:1938 start_codon:yes stop_codon:yes gene_type:complete